MGFFCIELLWSLVFVVCLAYLLVNLDFESYCNLWKRASSVESFGNSLFFKWFSIRASCVQLVGERSFSVGWF